MRIQKRATTLRSNRHRHIEAFFDMISRALASITKVSASGKRYFVLPVPSRKQVLRFMTSLLVVSGLWLIGYQVYRYYGPHDYNLNSAQKLLSEPNEIMAKRITYDSSKQMFNFESGQSNTDELRQTGATRVKAELPLNPASGMKIIDPTYDIDITATPRFSLAPGKQESNRIVYPFRDHQGWLVYTAEGTGVKEDIVLSHSPGDQASFTYTLELPSSVEARQEIDGSIGVYGNSVFVNNITAVTDTDKDLLEKARANARKDLLLFVIPAPVVKEHGKTQTNVKASFHLQSSTLTVTASGLNTASYPLSIDPSIYIVTAQQFMNGNNETNINFDVANKLIKKGRTTGARFDTWDNATSLPQSNWAGGTAVAGGYVYSVGGISQNGQVYTAQGTSTFTVPAGVTSISVKVWGGGGGGGAGGSSAAGGAGGGAGYVSGTITVTPGETLDVYVGGGGAAGTRNTSGGGGGGGGSSTIYRSTTPLAVSSGGGGGGGGRNTSTHIGGAGGAGGGAAGINGSASLANGGGGGGSTVGGTAGSGTNSGTAGSSLTGGLGANGSTGSSDGSGAIGGLAFGGNGGAVTSTTRAGGGGGGAGNFGGGGGAGAGTGAGGGGGGGGSSLVTGSLTTTSGSGQNPGNNADSDRAGAGQGGAAGATAGVGTAGTNGIITISYGAGGSTPSQTLNWSHLSTTDGSLESPNPGNGACSGWCTDSIYNLPSARTNYSIVAYNGFLYVIGGLNSAGTAQSTIYIAKLGANGEPQLWNPTWDPATDPNKTTWAYWHTDTGLSSARSGLTAIAYNNRMYVMGGRTTGSTTINTVEVADITPNGKLGGWSSSTALPYNLYGHSSVVYNDRLYIIGGNSTVNGTPRSEVYYNKINPNGTLNSWQQTSSFSGGRTGNGGNFATVWGAYVYVSGGCSTVNTNGYCTSIASDTQVASINADGSINVWNTVGNVANQRMGHTLFSWRDVIYEVGGCTAQNTTTGACTTTTNSIVSGEINRDGDASTVGQSVASGTTPCNGGAPKDCNLPGTTYTGNLLPISFISNGYLYVIGGCPNNTCTSALGNSAYTAISSTGDMTLPATCPSPRTVQGGMWCVDTTNTIPGGTAAGSPVVFNGRVYIVGGLDGSGNTNDLARADINPVNGSLSAWTIQTLSGLSVNNVSYTYAYARANPADATNNPGNLYIFGGCSNSSGAGCTSYSQNVYKCNIQTSGAIASCSTSGQQQIGTIPGDTASGLGIMSGTVYANYVYLIGGVSPNLVDLKTVRYAKIDNNNNIVAVSGGAWIQSPYEMAVGRRRSAAFGYNGYLYVVGGYEASTGVLADIEFIKINVSDGSLMEGWNVSAVEINQRWGLTVPVSSSYAYVIGGCTTGSSPGGCTARTDVVQTFQIYNNDSGAPAGFSTSANTYGTAPNRLGAASVILNGKLYVAGGCTSTTDCTTATSNVSYTTIGVDGSLGSWSSTTASLVGPRTWGKLLTVGGSLYYIGGQSSSATDERVEIYYATPTGSGDITSWTAVTNPLPFARTRFAATTWNERIYVVGGININGTTVGNVWVSPRLTSGGDITAAWDTGATDLAVPRWGSTLIAYANNLYLLGGYDGTNYLNDVQYAKINSTNGSVGSWSYTTSLPTNLSQAEGFATNGYIYLFGGRSDATTCSPNIYVAPISANTTIASGNNPTGVGDWFETNQRYTGDRYGAGAVHYDGKAYVLGGACGSTLSYASPVSQQTTLLTQPQIAKYSIMIDTDSDVFPNAWLLNGLDNSIGARWQLKYRSMANQNITAANRCATMATWGQETDFGNVTLGTPGSYVVKDGLGTNIQCARYYFFNVTVDSSQAFGYPDDVSRGPTITDLTLQFTADPSKRLMHGRTFTGGLQQPDDTPYYTQ